MKYRVLIFLLTFYCFSCNLTEAETGCGNKSIVTLAQTVSIGLKPVVLKTKHFADSSFIKSIVKSLDKLLEIEENMAIVAGGIDPETGILLYGCNEANQDTLNKTNLELETIIASLNNIKKDFIGSKEQETVDDIIETISNDIITYSYANKNYSEVIMNILVQHIKIYTIILDRYTFPKSRPLF